MSKAGYEARVKAWGRETADRFEYGIRAVPKVATTPIVRAPKRRRRRHPVKGVTSAVRSVSGFARLLSHGRR